jgi:hypothetical protein
MRADWASVALCKKDSKSYSWLSSNIDDINYAKDVCRRCSVRPECLYSAVYEKDQFIGVNAGMSEIEYLIRTWQEVDQEDESNWTKPDRLIQVLFREIA